MPLLDDDLIVIVIVIVVVDTEEGGEASGSVVSLFLLLVRRRNRGFDFAAELHGWDIIITIMILGGLTDGDLLFLVKLSSGGTKGVDFELLFGALGLAVAELLVAKEVDVVVFQTPGRCVDGLGMFVVSLLLLFLLGLELVVQ